MKVCSNKEKLKLANVHFNVIQPYVQRNILESPSDEKLCTRIVVGKYCSA